MARVGIDNEGQPDIDTIGWMGRKEPRKRYRNMCAEGPLAAPGGLRAARQPGAASGGHRAGGRAFRRLKPLLL